MRKIDSVLLSVIADFFINLSVFWFGAACIGPAFPGIDSSLKPVVLTADILAGIISLFVGYKLRKEHS